MDNINQDSQPLPSQHQAEQPQTSPSSSAPSKTFKILMGVLLLALVIIIIFTLAIKQNQPVVQNNQTTTPPTAIQPSPTPDETANWKTYTNQSLGIELKYPKGYQVFEESENKITIAKDQLGSGGFWILNNKDKSFGNYKELKPCKEVYEELKRNPSERPGCLDVGKSFGQEEDIANLRLGGVDAVSYYSTSTGQGGTFRIIQTVIEPLIEIYFFSDTTHQKTFQDQILSTFQFSN